MRRRFNCSLVIYEPIREFYEECAKRFSGLPQVTVVNAGVSDKNGRGEVVKQEECSSLYRDGVNLTTPNHEMVVLRDVADVVQRYTNVSLMTINAEGAEFEIIERLLATGMIGRFAYLQAEFHSFRLESKEREWAISQRLKDTHELLFAESTWKSWRRK